MLLLLFIMLLWWRDVDGRLNYQRDNILVSFFPKSQTLLKCLRNWLILNKRGFHVENPEYLVQVRNITKTSETFANLVLNALHFVEINATKLSHIFRRTLSWPSYILVSWSWTVIAMNILYFSGLAPASPLHDGVFHTMWKFLVSSNTPTIFWSSEKSAFLKNIKISTFLLILV